MENWTPTQERLPEWGVYVLWAFNARPVPTVGALLQHNPNALLFGPQQPTVMTDGSNIALDAFSHWMPCPATPYRYASNAPHNPPD